LPAIELIVPAILFVLSSGILFNEQYRKNAALVAIAAVFAIGSTISFLLTIEPSVLGGGSIDSSESPVEPVREPSPHREAPSPQKTPAKATEELKKASYGRLKPSQAADANTASANECDWNSESIDGCITRLRQTHDSQEATSLAFRSRAFKYLHEGDFAIAEDDLTVALQNEKNADDDPAYVVRGYARLKQKKYQSALDDCDKFNDSSKLAALSLAALSLLSDSETKRNAVGIVYKCRGIALTNLARHQEAVEVLDKAIATTGFNDWEVYDARATSRQAIGDKEGAGSDRHISNSLIVSRVSRLLKAWGGDPKKTSSKP